MPLTISDVAVTVARLRAEADRFDQAADAAKEPVSTTWRAEAERFRGLANDLVGAASTYPTLT